MILTRVPAHINKEASELRHPAHIWRRRHARLNQALSDARRNLDHGPYPGEMMLRKWRAAQFL